MEIILLERVENLGQMGDLVTVKPGYARNYLLPQGKALRATDANKARFENERAQLEAENITRKNEAEKIAQKMEGLNITLIRAASEMGQLYGSASSRDIAEAVSEAGFSINRTQVDLNTAMKTLGLFDINISLHPEVSVVVKVNIARSTDEAAEQLRLGRAIISDIAERERLDAAEAARKAQERIAAQEAEDESGKSGETGESGKSGKTGAKNTAQDDASSEGESKPAKDDTAKAKAESETAKDDTAKAKDESKTAKAKDK